MTIATTVRKGDVAALAAVRRIYGNRFAAESKTYFTLALVNSASRQGEAKSLQRVGGHMLYERRRDYRLSDVLTISQSMQPKAHAAFKRLTWDTDEFDSADRLRAFILESNGG